MKNLLLGCCIIMEGIVLAGCDDFQFPTSTTTIPMSIEMVNVNGGTFQMGDESSQFSMPIHTVTLADFMIGKFEITQAQFLAVKGINPSYFIEGGNANLRPVEQEKWYEAVEFCNSLSAIEGFDACYTIDGDTVTVDMGKNGFRLPTEAEWEFAAKGGGLSLGFTYAGSNDANSVGWYGENSGATTHVVGSKLPNELGLYDMSGNVREWCWDYYADSYIPETQDNPLGPSSGYYRVRRGGAWDFGATMLRSTARNFGDPVNRRNFTGFRVVRKP